MSNLTQSLHARLRKIAVSENKDFQLIFIRYIHERWLYRLSKSAYRDHFYLKGGALMYALVSELSRPTIDLDLLSKFQYLNRDELARIFGEICRITFPEDGMQYLADDIVWEDGVEQGVYTVVQMKIPGILGKMRQVLRIDVGFGDVVTPAPVSLQYPVLLPFEAPEIQAYSPETIIAEKFEAMISIGELNSRMKDFYDVYRLLMERQFDRDVLAVAIRETFMRRKTVLSPDDPLFKPEFVSNVDRNKLWDRFIQKSKLTPGPLFSDVMEVIAIHLKPGQAPSPHTTAPAEI